MFIYISLCLLAFAASVPTTNSEKSSPSCNERGDCETSSLECKELCGCDRIYYFNKTLNECVLDMEYLKNGLIEKYHAQEKIRMDTEKVFRGIIGSAIFFVACSTVCAVSACVYCCHINLSKIQLRDIELESIQMEPMLIPLGALVFMAFCSCLCCFSMRVSDNQLKNYIIDMAKRRGVNIDLEKLEPKNCHCQTSQVNENCAIFVPDVGIIL